MTIPAPISALIEQIDRNLVQIELEATEVEIQEIGEDLSEELGRAIETKLFINNLKKRLEELS